MKTYEAMFLLDNREVKKGWEPLKESIDSILTKRGAEIVVSKRWDERKLAYEIKKQSRATYYLSYMKAAPTAIDEMRRDLELTVPVLRYLILSCEEIPADAYEAEREFAMADDEPETKAVSEDGSEATDGKEASEGAEASEAAEGSEEAKAAEGNEEAKAAEGSEEAKAADTTTEVVAEKSEAEATEAEKPEENKE